ncbi:hypothetical protein ACWKSP_13770 [Micromonosporaceae bacterium Da 78-11]
MPRSPAHCPRTDRGRALAAYLDRSPTVETAALLPIPLLDRLATIGVVDARLRSGLPQRAAAHLRARHDPGGVDDATLQAAGFVAEQARRAYLAGADDTLAGLPDTDEAVRHYRSLRDYVSTGRLRDEDLRADARAVVKLTDAVSIDFAGRRAVPDQVAADQSTWSRLWGNAVLGKITVDDAVRERQPGFGFWLDTCRMHRTLLAGRWTDAADTGLVVARDAADPGTRVAALNLTAYARWQSGRVDEALGLLDQALAIRPTAGLAVNAALVAEDRGFSAVLPYLLRVMQLSGDARLRSSVVRRAVELSRSEDRGPDFPAAMGALVRAGLTEPPDDEALHHELLVLALRHDRGWLAGAAVRDTGTAQARVAWYYRCRAAMEEDKSTATMLRTSAALGRVLRVPSPPGWAGEELDRMVGALAEVLKHDFDRAVDPLPATQELLRHQLLHLAYRTQLAASVGAWLLGQIEWKPQPAAPPGETLLFAAVTTFHQRRGELSADEAVALARYLGVRVEQAVIAVGNAAVRFRNPLADQWKALQRAAATTWAANQPNMAARRALFETYQAHTERCARYLDLADGLPVEPDTVRWLGAMVGAWTTEITNLRRFV